MNPILVRASSESLVNGDLRVGPVGLASANLYVPMFAYFTGSLIKKGDKRDVIYSAVARYPLAERRETDTLFKRLFNNLRSGNTASGYAYDTRYFTHKHALYQVDNDHNVNFILLLAVRSDHFLSNIRRGAALDRSKLILFINNDINQEAHSSVKRRLKKYIDASLEGIDILYTDDINQWCFNNNLKNIRFKDIIGRMKFINEIKSKSYGKRGINEQQEPQAEQDNTPTGEGYIYTQTSSWWATNGTTYTLTSDNSTNVTTAS